jgi:hypothetical protein
MKQDDLLVDPSVTAALAAALVAVAVMVDVILTIFLSSSAADDYGVDYYFSVKKRASFHRMVIILCPPFPRHIHYRCHHCYYDQQHQQQW